MILHSEVIRQRCLAPVSISWWTSQSAKLACIAAICHNKCSIRDGGLRQRYTSWKIHRTVNRSWPVDWRKMADQWGDLFANYHHICRPITHFNGSRYSQSTGNYFADGIGIFIYPELRAGQLIFGCNPYLNLIHERSQTVGIPVIHYDYATANTGREVSGKNSLDDPFDCHQV